MCGLLLMSFNEMLAVLIHTLNANSIRALVHLLEKWWNINIMQVATVLCKQPFFKAQVWQKIHGCCDVFTSRCRMTIILLLTYSLDVKEYFQYQHYVFQMISRAHTAIESDSFDKKWLQIAKLRLFILEAIFQENFTFAAIYLILRVVWP